MNFSEKSRRLLTLVVFVGAVVSLLTYMNLLPIDNTDIFNIFWPLLLISGGLATIFEDSSFQNIFVKIAGLIILIAGIVALFNHLGDIFG
ncbi:hypothetical protein I0Q91_07620 [Halanaerobiaceae bacterium Z-7014]|uniref:Uncharacterized protein n=1 Tax=Halonatronomonas betaini TaxID=2778430 RepID=A0A931ART1_9FIRM|nr:hypothetical protein [Halonatronomonas betaini]MBF8436939.1 hypothetical protein [Halonatronomonas betaini]